jgi:hypothetical protein
MARNSVSRLRPAVWLHRDSRGKPEIERMKQCRVLFENKNRKAYRNAFVPIVRIRNQILYSTKNHNFKAIEQYNKVWYREQGGVHDERSARADLAHCIEPVRIAYCVRACV